MNIREATGFFPPQYMYIIYILGMSFILVYRTAAISALPRIAQRYISAVRYTNVNGIAHVRVWCMGFVRRPGAADTQYFPYCGVWCRSKLMICLKKARNILHAPPTKHLVQIYAASDVNSGCEKFNKHEDLLA